MFGLFVFRGVLVVLLWLWLFRFVYHLLCLLLLRLLCNLVVLLLGCLFGFNLTILTTLTLGLRTLLPVHLLRLRHIFALLTAISISISIAIAMPLSRGLSLMLSLCSVTTICIGWSVRCGWLLLLDRGRKVKGRDVSQVYLFFASRAVDLVWVAAEV